MDVRVPTSRDSDGGLGVSPVGAQVLAPFLTPSWPAPVLERREGKGDGGMVENLFQQPATVCRWAFLGRWEYKRAWDLQRSLARARAEDRVGDTLLFLEHPPVYTLGRRSKPADLLLPRDALEVRGAQLVDVDRGGEITFHGPGQLVGYPIISLRAWGGPLQYVRALEEALIRVLDVYGIAAGCLDGLTGVWAGGAKIAAIGVKVSRGVTTHGFALNVATDLSWFQNIVPCGIRDRDVTSMERLLGQLVPVEGVASVVAEQFGHVLGFHMEESATESVVGDKVLASTA
ncbi:MAG: lipoyl(octanoyl) transferase LipB [Dehalococcoidia bacterium]|nr:lipoyl(octanoyl) transferase LipB [Dehalococcoidia bacterium]